MWNKQLCVQNITPNNRFEPQHILTFGTKLPLKLWSDISDCFSQQHVLESVWRSVLHRWQQDLRDELWKQLRQLACFLSCSGHLQLHYMLTCCKWHCATRLWFTGTEPWTRIASLSSAPGLSATSNDLQNPNAAEYFHLNKPLILSRGGESMPLCFRTVLEASSLWTCTGNSPDLKPRLTQGFYKIKSVIGTCISVPEG